MTSEIAGPIQNAFMWDDSPSGNSQADEALGSRRDPRAENRPDVAERASAPATRRGEPVGTRDGWLTTDEAVAYLGLPSRKALYQAVRRGQVPARRLGVRRMRFSRDELDRLLRGEATEGSGE